MNEGQKRRIGIRTKLTGVIIPIVIAIIVVFFTLTRNMIVDLSKDKLLANSQIYSSEIGAWVNQILSELNVYKDTIEQAGFANDKEILRYMETSVDKYEAYPVGLYMGDDAGVYLDASGWVPGDDWVLTERDWYLEGKDNEVFAFGEPYYDSQSGDVCVSVTVRMNDPRAVRVLAVDVYLDYLSSLVSDMTEDKMDVAFFVTKDSQRILAHVDPDMIDIVLTQEGLDSLYGRISGEMAAGKIADTLKLKGDEGVYYININEIENTDWYLVTGMKRTEVLSGLRRVELVMVLVAVAAAAILMAVIFRLVSDIVKPVENVTRVLSCVAEGDFSQNIQARGHDEIAGMSRNMQNFLQQMRTTIKDISGTADWLSSQSEENGQVSQVLEDSSRHQREAVETLNRMVLELSGAAGQVAQQMEALTDVISRTKSEGVLAGETMGQTVSYSENGKAAMGRVSQGMERVECTIGSLSEQIVRAGEVTANIGSMVEMIKEIADETNLLSLNASIEAARAGEAGRGFAVVAEQINSLATNSKNAADKIQKLTEEITLTMEEANEQMKKSVSEVTDNAGIVAETSQTFHNVFEKVAETNNIIVHMVELVERVDQVALQMKEIADSQLSATRQIEESAGQLEDYTGTVSRYSNTVAENARKLEKESGGLTKKLNRFKV